MSATRWCVLTLLALLLNKVLWLNAGSAIQSGFAASLATALLPFLPFAAALAFKLRGLWIYAGIGVWIYFCHGAMEAVANPDARVWAGLEVLLSTAYFVALTWRIRAEKRARLSSRE